MPAPLGPQNAGLPGFSPSALSHLILHCHSDPWGHLLARPLPNISVLHANFPPPMGILDLFPPGLPVLLASALAGWPVPRTLSIFISLASPCLWHNSLGLSDACTSLTRTLQCPDRPPHSLPKHKAPTGPTCALLQLGLLGPGPVPGPFTPTSALPVLALSTGCLQASHTRFIPN